jgi:putative transposase
VVGVKRRRSLRVIQQDERLLPRVQALKAEHPFWGYRRIWAYLHFIENLNVNKKRIFRLMQEPYFLVPPNLRLKAKRTSMYRKPEPTKPNEWWGIDMTKVMVEGFGWVYVVVVLDWYTKKIVGYYAGLQCAARHWLAALDMAVNCQFPVWIRGQGLALMSDNGCQPTAVVFMRACATLEIHQAFTRDNNPKGNADTERFIRTLKEECLWLQEWTCPFELITALEAWMITYNEQSLHAALGYKMPKQFEQDHNTSPSPPFLAA